MCIKKPNAQADFSSLQYRKRLFKGHGCEGKQILKHAIFTRISSKTQKMHKFYCIFFLLVV